MKWLICIWRTILDHYQWRILCNGRDFCRPLISRTGIISHSYEREESLIHNKSAKFSLTSSDCYQFLYVDDYLYLPQERPEEKDEEDRGVVIIDLINYE